MSVSYEQEIKIKNFIEKFKSKGKVYGTIHIAIFDSGHSIDHQTFLDSDVDEAEQIGFIEGLDAFEESVRMMSACDLSDLVDEETANELVEYYKDKK